MLPTNAKMTALVCSGRSRPKLSGAGGVVVCDRQQGDAVGKLHVPTAHHVAEHEQGPCHQHEPHEGQQNNHFHDHLRAPSEATVRATMDNEVAGISRAQRRGVIHPASESPTAPTL
jgi:hypothetical protein